MEAINDAIDCAVCVGCLTGTMYCFMYGHDLSGAVLLVPSAILGCVCIGRILTLSAHSNICWTHKKPIHNITSKIPKKVTYFDTNIYSIVGSFLGEMYSIMQFSTLCKESYATLSKNSCIKYRAVMGNKSLRVRINTAARYGMIDALDYCIDKYDVVRSFALLDTAVIDENIKVIKYLQKKFNFEKNAIKCAWRIACRHGNVAVIKLMYDLWPQYLQDMYAKKLRYMCKYCSVDVIMWFNSVTPTHIDVRYLAEYQGRDDVVRAIDRIQHQ